MFEDYEQAAYELSQHCRKITPVMLMRKFKLTYQVCHKLCCKVWLKNNIEAKNLASDLEMFGFPAQLDKSKMKNLIRFKKQNKD